MVHICKLWSIFWRRVRILHNIRIILHIFRNTFIGHTFFRLKPTEGVATRVVFTWPLHGCSLCRCHEQQKKKKSSEREERATTTLRTVGGRRERAGPRRFLLPARSSLNGTIILMPPPSSLHVTISYGQSSAYFFIDEIYPPIGCSCVKFFFFFLTNFFRVSYNVSIEIKLKT